MGNCIRSMLRKLRRKQCTEKCIILLVVGLDNAGKTLVLNHITGDPDRNVLPTMGFRTVSLKHKSYVVKIYDVGVVLANKQDVNGAIDELDLVENLDVERAANTMRCPTRVETCSCISERDQSKDNAMGIKNGYKWLLDTIVKNYTALNNRVKESQNFQSTKVCKDPIVVPDTPSKLSVHSNPFKPIKELVSKKEELSLASNSQNGDIPTRLNAEGRTNNKNKKIKMFISRNKTAPVPPDQSIAEFENALETSKSTTVIYGAQKSTQTISSLFDPIRLEEQSSDIRLKPSRPYTAPVRSEHFMNKVTVINIPGQVIQ